MHNCFLLCVKKPEKVPVIFLKSQEIITALKVLKHSTVFPAHQKINKTNQKPPLHLHGIKSQGV